MSRDPLSYIVLPLYRTGLKFIEFDLDFIKYLINVEYMLARAIWFIVDILNNVFLRNTLIDFKVSFFKYIDLSLLVRLRKYVIYKIKLLEVRVR